MAFLIGFDCGQWKVVVDDDDRAVYAYLLKDDEVVGDVWICNRVRPAEPEWKLPNADELMPFLNPVPYVESEHAGVAEHDPESISVSWSHDGDSVSVQVLDAGKVLARLVPGERPGWCVNAKLSGPLAQVL